MFARSLCAVLLLISCAEATWGGCRNDPNPPSVIQLGARSPCCVVRELRLINVVHATVGEQHQIEAALVGLCFPENKQSEVSERIRAEFQDFGFFQAAVTAVTIEPANPKDDPPTVSVIARVDDGQQYHLEGITFTGNQAITNTASLRSLVPIKDGDIFNTRRIREGLDALAKAYGELGYINFTSVPDTRIDEENGLIRLRINVDEGTRFFIKSFTVKDSDAQREAALRDLWPEMLQPGRVYDMRLVSEFLAQAQAEKLLPPDVALGDYLQSRLDESKHTVDLVLTVEPR